MITILIVVLSAYLLGGIPFGFLLARCYRLDITKVGSGNIGATNVWRTLGPLAGILVFLLDGGKGWLAVFWAQQNNLPAPFILLAALAAVAGHTFSPFLKFKGGRGAATGLGTLLALAPPVFVGTLLTFGLVLFFWRYVSLASLSAAVMTVVFFVLFGYPTPYQVAATLIALLIIIRHLPNIQRLREGKEPRLGDKRE